MKILKKILWAIIALFFVTLIIASFLPRECKLERSILIDTTPDIIYFHVNNLHRWESWTALDNVYGSDVQKNFSGPDEGVGSEMIWSGKGSSGKLSVTALVPQKSVKVMMTIDGETLKTSNVISLDPRNNGTRVTWTATIDLGWSPLRKIHGLFLNSEIGDDYENGLVRLKEICEHGNDPKSV